MDIKNQFKCFTCYSEVLNLNYSLSSIRLGGVLKKPSYKYSEGEESVNQRQFCLAYLHITNHSETTKTNVQLIFYLPLPSMLENSNIFFSKGNINSNMINKKKNLKKLFLLKIFVFNVFFSRFGNLRVIILGYLLSCMPACQLTLGNNKICSDVWSDKRVLKASIHQCQQQSIG